MNEDYAVPAAGTIPYQNFRVETTLEEENQSQALPISFRNDEGFLANSRRPRRTDRSRSVQSRLSMQPRIAATPRAAPNW